MSIENNGFLVKIWSLNKEEAFEYDKQRFVDFEGEVIGMDDGEIRLYPDAKWTPDREITDDNKREVKYTRGIDCFVTGEVCALVKDGRFRCRLPMIFESPFDPNLGTRRSECATLPCTAEGAAELSIYGEDVEMGLGPLPLSVGCLLLEPKSEELSNAFIESHNRRIAIVQDLQRTLLQREEEANKTKTEISEQERLLADYMSKVEEIQRAIQTKQTIVEEQEEDVKELKKEIIRGKWNLQQHYGNLIDEQIVMVTVAKDDTEKDTTSA